MYEKTNIKSVEKEFYMIYNFFLNYYTY